ncbi:MAG: hypothetical protein AVDCRST_MAG07-680, partial [uncultured Frankineae bacterium]
ERAGGVERSRPRPRPRHPPGAAGPRGGCGVRPATRRRGERPAQPPAVAARHRCGAGRAPAGVGTAAHDGTPAGCSAGVQRARRRGRRRPAGAVVPPAHPGRAAPAGGRCRGRRRAAAGDGQRPAGAGRRTARAVVRTARGRRPLGLGSDGAGRRRRDGRPALPGRRHRGDAWPARPPRPRRRADAGPGGAPGRAEGRARLVRLHPAGRPRRRARLDGARVVPPVRHAGRRVGPGV